MYDTFEISEDFPVSAKKLYEAWLDSREHSGFTGSEAVIDSNVNGLYTAWDGYIRGKNLELSPAVRILQTWRTTEFPEDAEDSLLEVLFQENGGKTKLLLRHSKLPEGSAEEYRQGWIDYYFTPMRVYFTA